ncbi:dehydrogenase E1 and transketolase domain-containing protein 1 [Panaeolus papilionaceus]|nr:dehydrogenase E1 and transketolase domain-containing protein 1 [Panaeolus papilionaceus]
MTRRRDYHDESFGFRKPRQYEFPDYTPTQLANRAKNAALLRYVDSMRTHGHRAARIDPLDLIHRDDVAALSPARYGLTDPDEKFDVNGILWTRRVGQGSDEPEMWTLREIEEGLRRVYVGNIAHEYMHSPSKTERLWFSHLLESQTLPSPNDRPLIEIGNDHRKRIHSLLARSEVFDNFLQVKFPNLKRYGLEGGESMLPALDSLFSAAALAGLQHIILAMPHRGRLNLLTDLLQYSPAGMFNKIRGGFEMPEELGADGDVLSHLVSSPHLTYNDPSGSAHELKVSLLPNPSHLEAVNPVAMGKTRAKQYSLLKTSPDDCSLGDKVMCVQLHGDAAFTGQGVVMESLGLSNLPHFTSGGSVHLVVDIGYTTPASNARSSLYCSDIGKMINAPVLHVNGDYPEDVARAMDIAFRYRNYFRKDIIVDLLHANETFDRHNELDLPNLTSPLMYEKIAARKSVPVLYEEKLINNEVLSPAEASEVRQSYKSHLESELQKVSSYVPSASMLAEQWKGIVWPGSAAAEHDPATGVDVDLLKEVGKGSVQIPQGFEIHSKLGRHVKSRLKSLETGTGLDFATAEALAMGTLLLSGNDVRISGQDVGRGTFSHRHAMLVDQKTEKVTVPLNEFETDVATEKERGRLELANSSLSEMAVLGFEYGLSWEKPDLLPIWEAQFGDFFNGAQVIIDTFISSGETKWLKQSGIVMMLPHGLDGAGPEHSSSRIERFLQLTNDRYDSSKPRPNINMHVVYPTTPAQYFHLLRRQLLRNYRKPLIVASPKGLLRLAAASSALEDMAPGTKFQPVLADSTVQDPNSIKRVVMLSGKLYYDLVKHRQSLVEVAGANDVDPSTIAFVRIEEIAPFPFAELGEVLRMYPYAEEFGFVHEEPRNQGVLGHVKERIEKVLKDEGINEKLVVVGRTQSAVPAPGVGVIYKKTQAEVIDGAFRSWD